jgi:hypothetical protein
MRIFSLFPQTGHFTGLTSCGNSSTFTGSTLRGCGGMSLPHRPQTVASSGTARRQKGQLRPAMKNRMIHPMTPSAAPSAAPCSVEWPRSRAIPTPTNPPTKNQLTNIVITKKSISYFSADSRKWKEVALGTNFVSATGRAPVERPAVGVWWLNTVQACLNLPVSFSLSTP